MFKNKILLQPFLVLSLFLFGAFVLFLLPTFQESITVIAQSDQTTPLSSPLSTPIPATNLLTTQLNASSQSLTASPSRLGDDYSLTLVPGTKTTVTVQLYNPTDQPQTILTTAQDFIVGGDDGETPIIVSSPNNRWAMADWLTIAGSVNTLEPYETVTIPVLISVPEKARSGGHYAMLVHQILTPAALSQQQPVSLPAASDQTVTAGIQTQSQINTQLGQMLYVIVPGNNLTEALEITGFSFDTLRESGPIHYSFEIKNTSDFHTHPVGQIAVTNLARQTVATFPIDSNQNMFPETTRQYEGVWDRSWGFGPYTATLNLIYGPNETLLTAQTTFWILPVRFLILIFLIIACIAVVSYNLHKKKMREDKEKNTNAKK